MFVSGQNYVETDAAKTEIGTVVVSSYTVLTTISAASVFRRNLNLFKNSM